MNVDTFRRGICPKFTEQDVHDLLWECTAFPFRKDVRKLRRQMREALRHGGGTLAGATAWAYQQLDEAMSARAEAEFNAEAEKARERIG